MEDFHLNSQAFSEECHKGEEEGKEGALRLIYSITCSAVEAWEACVEEE